MAESTPPTKAMPTTAGIILVQSNPLNVVKTIELSRASYHKMIENLVWATEYNLIALPLAAGIVAPWGILLSPVVGALLMSLSTVIVGINAQTLRRSRLGVDHDEQPPMRAETPAASPIPAS